MKKLKKKILTSLNNSRHLEKILKELPNYQSILLKNYSNPVFSKNIKKSIMNSYDNLEKLGKSLYRLKNFLMHNALESAEIEKDNVKNIVLKGGISNTRYIWHSENSETTCDECMSLDGQEFDFYDEIPERPHPNCKCYVEVLVQQNDDSKKEDDTEEECDCWKWEEEFNQLIDQFKTLKEVVSINMAKIYTMLRYDIPISIMQTGDSILHKWRVVGGFVDNLASNFEESRNNIFANSDKYYHAKAFCEVAQRESEISNILAMGAGYFRESYQWVENLVIKQKTWEEACEEYLADTHANKQGLELGKEHPYEDCAIIIKSVWPKIIRKN